MRGEHADATKGTLSIRITALPSISACRRCMSVVSGVGNPVVAANRRRYRKRVRGVSPVRAVETFRAVCGDPTARQSDEPEGELLGDILDGVFGERSTGGGDALVE